MNIVWAILSLAILSFASQVFSKPFSFDDDEDYADSIDSEGRRRHKKKPCQRSVDGRTFFPVQLSYVDVNYNNNCGGQNSGHSFQEDTGNTNSNKRPHKPHNHGGNGHRPSGHRPQSNGHGSNKPNRPQSDDEVTVATAEDVPNDAVQESTFSTTRRPHRPGFFLQNHNGALVQNLFGTLFGNTSQRPQSGMIPVHEKIEDDVTTKFEPGQYITAYSPLTGQYVQDVSNLKPKRLYRRFSKGLDHFLGPIYDLF